MKKIIITGAGSAQSNGVINSLLMGNGGEEIIGLGAMPEELVMCNAHKKYLMPYAKEECYKEKLLSVLIKEKPDMIHFQHDFELSVAVRFRDEIEAIGVRMLVPDNETIDTCVHKYKSWLKFKAAGIVVPENLVLKNKADLKYAFDHLGNEDGTIWLRSMSIGGGGKGSLPTSDLEEACDWIDRCHGWGDFVAAQLLTTQTVTWLSIWHAGSLVVGQTRRRKSWAHSSLSPSGITGVTKVGETWHDESVDSVAISAVKAVSAVPHGIYGVDMTYDKNGIPNPTEINISRFFTTVQFFSEAGLNMPVILKDIVLYNKFPNLPRVNNPLPDGLLWLRGMDCAPMLTTEKRINEQLLIA
ncbi:MAG TPA: hypothetical protein VEZ52_11475 [Desulfovibrio sp.]|uniref:hypothetical protein n=1 Tax=Desulfovibrio sp. TaxID=885 RepID=UPI002D68096F|nr:hypothetical protein [Desulfovibrio sp.]HZF62227.1 hypothetical protein [Desulfovibrio sp.]